MDTIRPAELLELRASPSGIGLLLDCDDERFEVDVNLTRAGLHALAHLAAVYAHTTGCPAAAPNVLVDVLVQCIAGSRALPAYLLIRLGAGAPGFWLRMTEEDGPRDINLDPLDAYCLFASRRFPIHLQRPEDAQDWDAALRNLLDSGGA
jgi:hypothetical protein